MSISARDIDRIYGKLEMEIRETHHRWAFFVHEGEVITKTRRSLGRGKLKGIVPDLIRQQLKLNDEQFNELLKSKFKREGYIDILRDKGILRN